MPIPPLDSAAALPCPDPGIDRDARIALARTRRALADCEDRRAAAAAHLKAVAAAFGPP